MDTATDTPPPLRFASFELDIRSRELRTGAKRIRLQEQPFEILRLMLERPGVVVTREELCRRLWPSGTFVDFEHSLNAAVKRLRAALGDDAEHPRFVETLPRRGYRFIAAVNGSASSTSSAPAPVIARHVAARIRLAVLPFSNLGEDSAQEYFSDGLTEEMIAQLGELCRGRIGIIARWSSMVFKGSLQRAREIGEALGAHYLLEGSVRCEGDRVRITARLIETASETHMWSETYERHLTDYLSVQTEVAARISRSLAMELVTDARESTPRPDAAAYQTYLKGRYFWNKPGDQGLGQAISFFEQAVAQAPSFAGAHSALARAWVARAEYYHDVPRTLLAKAQASAIRALDLDSDLSEAHMALADVQRMLTWDWDAAEASYLHAITINPSYESGHRAYAVMLAALGRTADAIREAERARELDPLCLTVNLSDAWVRYTCGDYDRVIERCCHTIDMDGSNVAARRMLGAAYLQAGDHAMALAAFESALASVEPDPVMLAWLAHAQAVTGNCAAAAALIASLRTLAAHRYVPSYHLALAHVGVGDIDAAFDALDQAYLDRDPVLAHVAVEPRFESLRSDARYERLTRRLNLT